MALKSRLFAGDPKLEACLVQDSAHLTIGARGDHVTKVQAVVTFLDGSSISDGELEAKLYGPSTAAAVQAYKAARNIIATERQSKADAIVGKMTIQALDDELCAAQTDPDPPGQGRGHCPMIAPPLPGPAVSDLQHKMQQRRLALAVTSRAAALRRTLV